MDINHLISAATVNNWASETLFSIFSAESSLQPLGSPLGVQGDGAFASGLFIYYLFHLLQDSEQIGIGKKWRVCGMIMSKVLMISRNCGESRQGKTTGEKQDEISFQVRTAKKIYL